MNQPYSCNQWGSTPDGGGSQIVHDTNTGGSIYSLFGTDNFIPSTIWIDHNMVVYDKMNSAGSWSINSRIKSMLEDCGECYLNGVPIEDGGSSSQSYQRYCCEEFGGEYFENSNPQENYCVGSDTSWLSLCDPCTSTIDCSGLCNGDTLVDECGVCGGEGAIYECGCTGPIEQCRDLDGDGFGTNQFTLLTCDIEGDIWVTNCDDLDDTVYCESNINDCSGILCGDNVIDECNICDTNPNNDCVQDCMGIWGGEAVVDECNICDADSSNNCVQDCNGIWGGMASIDCEGICNGIAVLDQCGICDSNNSNDCTLDCNGTWGGTAILDQCGTCQGNGIQDFYADWDGDGYGDCDSVYPFCPNDAESWVSDVCGDCDNSDSNVIYNDCAGTCGGLAMLDDCGICDLDQDNDCITCTSYGLFEDDCGECVQCDEFCNCDLEICDYNNSHDDCGICFGDNSTCQMLGDTNGDSNINVVDIVLLVEWILNGGANDSGDLNQDGAINVVDIVMLVDIILNP